MLRKISYNLSQSIFRKISYNLTHIILQQAFKVEWTNWQQQFLIVHYLGPDLIVLFENLDKVR